MANGSLLNDGVGAQGIYDMQSIMAQTLFGLLIPKAWQTSNEDVNPFILYATIPPSSPFPNTHQIPLTPSVQPPRKQRHRLPPKPLVRMGFRLHRRHLRRLLQQPILLPLQRQGRPLPPLLLKTQKTRHQKPPRSPSPSLPLS